jgi:hypothetical protein
VLLAGSGAVITAIALPMAAAAASPGGDGEPTATSMQLLVEEGDGQVVLTFYEGA